MKSPARNLFVVFGRRFLVAIVACLIVSILTFYIVAASWPVRGAPDEIVKDGPPPTLTDRFMSGLVETSLFTYFKIQAPFAHVARTVAPSNGWTTLLLTALFMATVATVLYSLGYALLKLCLTRRWS